MHQGQDEEGDSEPGSQPFAHRHGYVAPVRRIHVPTDFTKPHFTVRDKVPEIETIYRAYQGLLLHLTSAEPSVLLLALDEH
jgi:hypothetical protein